MVHYVQALRIREKEAGLRSEENWWLACGGNRFNSVPIWRNNILLQKGNVPLNAHTGAGGDGRVATGQQQQER